MKIGVTGGSGFIGRYFLSAYSENNEFIVATRKKSSELCSYDNIKYCECDYRVDSIINCFSGCDAIVHLASIRPDSENEKSITNYFDNIVITENLLAASRQLGIKNIVVISTRSVYSSSQKMPVSEDYTLPCSLYGISKMTVENLCELYNRKYDMKIKCLRFAQVIGVGERRNLLTIYLDKCLKKEKLPVYGKGVSSKIYIYIKDAVRAIYLCLLSDMSGAFNISMSGSVSNKELAAAYCEVFENESGYELLTDKEEDGEYWELDIKKAKDVLGFEPEFSLKAALLDMKKITENG